MTPLSLREQLLQPRATPAGECRLPGRGVTVFVRRWSLGESLQAQAMMAKGNPLPVIERVAAVCRMALAGPDNARLFADDDPAIYDALDAEDLDAILDAALTLNRMTKAAHDAGKPSGGETPTSPSSPPSAAT